MHYKKKKKKKNSSYSLLDRTESWVRVSCQTSNVLLTKNIIIEDSIFHQMLSNISFYFLSSTIKLIYMVDSSVLNIIHALSFFLSFFLFTHHHTHRYHMIISFYIYIYIYILIIILKAISILEDANKTLTLLFAIFIF
jgi:hypothetical protein